MQMKTIAMFGAVLALPFSAAGSTWIIDPAHSSAQFSVRHMMVSTVRGEFSKVSGTIQMDESDLTRSSVEATIETASINTREAARDKHLKSPDFFDVEKYPAISFKSKGITKGADGRYKMTGDLTIHGTIREVTLDVDPLSPAVKGPGGSLRSGTSAVTKVNRKDFGLNWNRALETGGVVVGEEVTITIDVELIQKTGN